MSRPVCLCRRENAEYLFTDMMVQLLGDRDCLQQFQHEQHLLCFILKIFGRFMRGCRMNIRHARHNVQPVERIYTGKAVPFSICG